MLAANARPLQDLVLEQYQYLYQLNPTNEMKAEVQKITTQIKYLNSSNFNASSPKEKLPLNLPAGYWQSLKKYNQIEVAKTITTPLLIIQGEHDYQVTMKDYNLWKTALKNKTTTTFISYPKLNHLMLETEKMSTPEDYQKANHIPDYLTKNIAKWILQIK